MEQRSTISTHSPSEAGVFASLAGESFSSLLRGLTLRQPLKEVLAVVRKAALPEWNVDEARDIVSLDSPDLRVSFSPNASGSASWLAATTRWGQISLSRHDPDAGLIERAILRKLESLGTQLAKEISPSWVVRMAGSVADKSIGWTAQLGGVQRERFGQGSYRESALSTFSASTDSGLMVTVNQLETVLFISSSDAYQEDRRYAEQCIDFARQECVSKAYVFSPFPISLSSLVPRQPDPPLSCGTKHVLSQDVCVHSIAIDKIARAFNLQPKPVIHVLLEESK